MVNFAKHEVSLRYWLLGKSYFKALDAMAFAKSYHTGVRKDKVTPEFHHQISIVHFIRTLPNLMHPEDTICTGFLHDVREDYGVADTEISERFGSAVAKSVDAMTKEFRGVKRDPKLVFQQIGEDPCASIAKLVDRTDNYGSMVGVFNMNKQIEYLNEGDEHFLPMVKVSRRIFPRQESAYEILKHFLNSQISLIRAIHAA